MGKFKIKFPCGFEIEGQSSFHYFGDCDLERLYYKGCPIHGKKCNKKS